METEFIPSNAVSAIREQVSHPILDGDGHHIEFMPLVYDLAREIAGPSVVEHYRNLRARPSRAGIVHIPQGFALPAENTLDRVTATVPKLLYRRLDQIGVDFALLYPSAGLGVPSITEREVRQVAARALNTYNAEVFAGYRDRLEPVATIPTNTPDEAIEELDHAVLELGLKAVVMSGSIPRTPLADGRPGSWIDALGHGSLYDYTPLWQRCVDLGVTPTFHGVGNGWGTRVSTSNFVHNHLGHFAAAQEGVCRALVVGGVPARFPTLRFAFLEGGVAWALQLLCDLLGHFEKRNRDVVESFDPRRQDRALRQQLFEAHAEGRLVQYFDRLEEGFAGRGADLGPEQNVDDFAESGIRSARDILEIFDRQFFFGCEADDPLNPLAFGPPTREVAGLNAMFASDIGHFDVTDMRDVLVEAWEAVGEGYISTDDFRAFSCTNLIRLLTSGSPEFFAGTAVAGYVEEARGTVSQ